MGRGFVTLGHGSVACPTEFRKLCRYWETSCWTRGRRILRRGWQCGAISTSGFYQNDEWKGCLASVSKPTRPARVVRKAFPFSAKEGLSLQSPLRLVCFPWSGLQILQCVNPSSTGSQQMRKGLEHAMLTSDEANFLLWRWRQLMHQQDEEAVWPSNGGGQISSQCGTAPVPQVLETRQRLEIACDHHSLGSRIGRLVSENGNDPALART